MQLITLIKPQRVHEGYVCRLHVYVCVRVCVSVCYHTSSYIPGFHVQSEVIYSFLQAFKDMYCVLYELR